MSDLSSVTSSPTRMPDDSSSSMMASSLLFPEHPLRSLSVSSSLNGSFFSLGVFILCIRLTGLFTILSSASSQL